MIKGYFDPGGACAGYAIFDGEEMVECGLSRTKLKEVGPRSAAHRKAVHARWWSYQSTTRVDVNIRSEMMWHRPRKSKKGDYIPPQDLIHTNLIAGHVGTEWIYPHAWKGMVRKAIHQPKILAALTPKELALVEAVMPPSLRHNVIDAVGIGLHDVGRLTAEAETEACQQVKRLIKRTASKAVTRSFAPGRSSSLPKGKRGKRQPTRPSFITLPKGAMRMPAPTAPATFLDAPTWLEERG